MDLLRFLATLICISFCYAYTTNYQGHQVWRVKDISPQAADDIRSVIDSLELDVWASGTSWLDVQVTPEMKRFLGRSLARKGYKYTVQINDLQSLIDEELKVLKNSPKTANFDFANYHEYSEIEGFMSDLANTYDWVSLESIGKTYEERDMWVNILAVPGDSPKPAIWMDCGIHAREWISPATCIYGLNYLTTGYSTIDEVTQLLDRYDIYMMPVLNPDGYSFTWSDDRLWRKNRVDNQDGCYGVDLNRNFDDGNWGGIGASHDSCSDKYCGTAGFSELEAQHVRDYTTGLMATNDLKAYYTIHSYRQLWMYAYGWTSEHPAEIDQLEAAAKIGVDAMNAVHGTIYNYGTIYDAIYPSSGGSIDWGYSAGVVHTYALELRDTGEYGVLLPPEQIIPTAEETWAGLIASITSL